MLDRNLQHPSITAIERTGHPPEIVKAKPVVCSRCGYPVIGEGADGVDDVVCLDCLEIEFDGLTRREQLEAKAAACGRDIKHYG